ncbi:hypothetical protein NQ015_08390 [Corynebacterium sp. 153RC1]|uniref:DUF6779 domain-containing protein n=1 Tax=unclassified Corynebacterium TaxID=2624378 RepID=UPI00211BAA48|nr:MULTISPECIES: DUF6779 domain-containing protein [unclassified Corynebacterium]MCQ9371749.1 hypothetical protein [Corynebacterium sp. 35RC1]MCQ9353086.1 hypothetical protein [Corynebacterium sp. 209RC1]MCQ9355290.1 hypothetical protein [Corynebacterium sp. 1222RC1]MCQ9357536.1 hypothetical protein [Corynebacterium sp. 122RC1]MCQ9359113.1 hypothetical protein [Corynebacterium sp. 142RC1]
MKEWVLIALAVVCSIVTLTTGSVPLLKIALLISLWAALGGAFMVARLRQQQAHEDSLSEIRAQLDAMREQLEELSGYSMAQQPALHAEAQRIAELPAADSDPDTESAGRRRADAHTNGISVAELIARNRK